MKIILILMFGFITKSHSQDKFELLTKRKVSNTLLRFDKLNNSNFLEYDIIFQKKDSIDFGEATFLIKYYSGDTLLIAFDGIKKSTQKEIALKFFKSKVFLDFNYFVIIYGKSKLEEDEEGDLLLKKFKPKRGFKKVKDKT